MSTLGILSLCFYYPLIKVQYLGEYIFMFMYVRVFSRESSQLCVNCSYIFSWFQWHVLNQLFSDTVSNSSAHHLSACLHHTEAPDLKLKQKPWPLSLLTPWSFQDVHFYCPKARRGVANQRHTQYTDTPKAKKKNPQANIHHSWRRFIYVIVVTSLI